MTPILKLASALLQVNNRLLEDIHRQNADLKRKMEQVQVATRQQQMNLLTEDEDDEEAEAYTRRKTAPPSDLTDCGGMNGLNAVSDSGVAADDDDHSSGEDSTLSFNSTQTDRTWKEEEVSVAEGAPADLTSKHMCRFAPDIEFQVLHYACTTWTFY